MTGGGGVHGGSGKNGSGIGGSIVTSGSIVRAVVWKVVMRRGEVSRVADGGLQWVWWRQNREWRCGGWQWCW